MAKSAGNDSAFKLEVKPDRVVSDGAHEVSVRCVFKLKKADSKEDIPVVLACRKLKIKEEKSAHKGSVTFKFKPTRPTGKTLIKVSSPLGVQTAVITVIPTPYQYIRDMLQAIILAVIIAFGVIRPFLIQTYYIPSASMEPTFYENDRLIGLMFPFRFHDPKPGEIVIFQRDGEFTVHSLPLPFHPLKWKSKTNFIKRVIAVGGDMIEVRDMTVYVNNKPLKEPYVKQPPYNNFAAYKLPKNTFFMMGDNRNNSLDSRFWGALPRKGIVSKAWVQFWPPDRMKIVR
ncbi:MAG: signal peptidase I [bacterium]